jgi:hypothetical protein
LDVDAAEARKDGDSDFVCSGMCDLLDIDIASRDDSKVGVYQ